MANNEQKIKEEVKQFTSEQAENLSKQVQNILEKIEELTPKEVSKAYDKATSKIVDMKDNVAECCSNNKIVKKVKDNPVHSTLALLTLGFIIGAVIHKYKDNE